MPHEEVSEDEDDARLDGLSEAVEESIYALD